MNTNFDRLDRHTDGRKTHRPYLNTHYTDIQTDNMCSVWMMHTAAGFCLFVVCNVYSNGVLRMAFSNWFTWHNLDQGFSTFCYSHTPKSILSPFVYSQIKIDPLCVPPSTLLFTFCMLILIYWNSVYPLQTACISPGVRLPQVENCWSRSKWTTIRYFHLRSSLL